MTALGYSLVSFFILKGVLHTNHIQNRCAPFTPGPIDSAFVLEDSHIPILTRPRATCRSVS